MVPFGCECCSMVAWLICGAGESSAMSLDCVLIMHRSCTVLLSCAACHYSLLRMPLLVYRKSNRLKSCNLEVDASLGQLRAALSPSSALLELFVFVSLATACPSELSIELQLPSPPHASSSVAPQRPRPRRGSLARRARDGDGFLRCTSTPTLSITRFNRSTTEYSIAVSCSYRGRSSL